MFLIPTEVCTESICTRGILVCLREYIYILESLRQKYLPTEPPLPPKPTYPYFRYK